LEASINGNIIFNFFVLLGLGIRFLEFLAVDRHQSQLSDDAKRRSSGFGRETGVEILETDGLAGFLHTFSKKVCEK